MDLDPLRQDITAVLEECCSRGMQLPFLFVAVSLDGKLIGVRFTAAEDSQGLDAVPIAGNPNAIATMPMPINLMIVDATGQAACALISCPGQVTFRYPWHWAEAYLAEQDAVRGQKENAPRKGQGYSATMFYSRRTHKVEIGGKPHEVTVYRDSKTVWIATGRYMGETLEVKAQSAGSAIELWKDAANKGSRL